MRACACACVCVCVCPSRCVSYAQDQQSELRLDSVPYGTAGPWALNLWFKANNSAHPSGTGVQYIFSHVHTDDEPAGALNTNQVRAILATHPVAERCSKLAHIVSACLHTEAPADAPDAACDVYILSLWLHGVRIQYLHDLDGV